MAHEDTAATEKWTRERALEMREKEREAYHEKIAENVDKLIAFLQANRDHIGAYAFVSNARMGDVCENLREDENDENRFLEGMSQVHSNFFYDNELLSDLNKLCERQKMKVEARRKLSGGGGGGLAALAALLAGALGR